MKWVIPLVMCILPLVPIKANAQVLAHTGVPCQTYQTLKKEHPSQHIFYETVEGKKCYHVHVPIRTAGSANSQTTHWDASLPHKMNKNEEVLDWFSTPIMKWFYNEYTRGRNF